MEHADGMKVARTRGTPQGGVVSPILANLFLHYAFDLWMARTHPDLPWCRYADDGLVHCRNEQEAQALKAELQARRRRSRRYKVRLVCAQASWPAVACAKVQSLAIAEEISTD
jgi:retron-type reverse transcriptase